MPRRTDQPQTARHVIIDDADWAFLSQLYGRNGLNKNISVGEAVRTIIGQKCNQLRQKFADAQDSSVN